MTRYLSLAEYFWLAEQVTGVEAAVLTKGARVELADAALHAPALVMFVDLNGGAWDPEPPNVDEAEAAMLTVAAREVDEAWLADWLRERVLFG